MDDNETRETLWQLVDEEVRISIAVPDGEEPTGASILASFSAKLLPPPEWVGRGWRPLDLTTPTGEEPIAGAGHVTATLDASSFEGGSVVHDGRGVEACFTGGVRVIVVKLPKATRVVDAASLSP